MLGALALGSACRDQGGVPVDRRDAGTSALTCMTTTDCGGTGVCVAGLCQQVTSCNEDSECAADNKVCHNSRFFCVDCDGREGQCDTGFRCQFDFTCAEVTTSTMSERNCMSSCTDRSMCNPDQVCDAAMGQCCDPPRRCRSPADCPTSQPECNGANGSCFGGDGCFDDNECEQQPGCAGGLCECEIVGGGSGTCVMRGAECANDMDCFDNGTYDGKYCTLAMPPPRCIEAPMCTDSVACSRLGLVCDMTQGSPSFGRCKNGDPCPMGNECGANQVCANGVCVGENCSNNPALCGQNEMCDGVSLTCVPVQGGTCTVDTDCQAGYYCETSISECRVGCRDNSECGSGICNAMHQCEQPAGGLCGACATDADCPAGASCKDITGQMKCYEDCNTFTGQDCMIDPSATCFITVCSCL
ncbi:MAG: hypothetical protein RIT81_22350 [Deltaproteobacteria bacterium]